MHVRAVVVTEPGGPEQLRIVDRPAPRPGPDDVLVAVRTTSVNGADLLQRRGGYPPPEGATDILGLEAAGEVIEVGDRVTSCAVGDRVCGLLPGGGYGEYAVLPASLALPLPDAVDWTQAGGLAEVFATAYDNMLTRGRLTAGETVLIHGIASGVGTAATQLAVRAGARVIGTASTPDKRRAAEALGADATIDYTSEDFGARVDDLTDGRGVDVVLDVVGAPYLQRNLDVLALDGRLVIVSVIGGHQAELSLRQLMARRLTITASTLRARSVEEKAVVSDALRRDVLPGFADGSLRVVVDSIHDLDHVVDAHRTLEAGQHVGKVIISVSD
jgi:putative PIG3 family NAD(P)H quinone oxidoreductase